MTTLNGKVDARPEQVEVPSAITTPPVDGTPRLAIVMHYLWVMVLFSGLVLATILK